MLTLRDVLDCTRRISGYPWKPVATWQLAATSLGLAWFLYLLKTDDEGFIFLDHVNLVFHEAGHPIFGLFGDRLGLYGGTIGQLAIPVAAWLAFWRQRDTIGCTVAGVWFFENFLNIAHYMADARAHVLPLVGGGEHDWTEIFSRWGVLTSDAAIAQWVSGVGWVGMLATWSWLLWRWLSPSHSSSS